MRAPARLPRLRGPARTRAAIRAVKGYGRLVWLPFSVLIIAFGVLSHSPVLFGASVVWSVIMTFYGARIPHMVFACFLQATNALAGCAYLGFYHYYPGGVADSELAPLAASAVLLATLVVCSTYWLLVRAEKPGDARLGESFRMLKLSPTHMFILLLIIFSPEWLRLSTATSSTGGFRQIVTHIMTFRLVLYALFFINALRANRRKIYWMVLAISFYIVLPMSVTGHAGWSGVVILALMLYAGSLAFPIAKGGARLTPAGIAVTVFGVLFLAGFGLVWEGGLKSTWRSTLARSDGELSMVQSLSAFSDDGKSVVQNFELSHSLEVLAGRMSTGEGFFSLVLSNVPKAIPYARGERVTAAVQNLLPRILFPDKKDLGGDSWLVRKYAQVAAAGDDEGASIGLGYVPEMYIDFGVMGIVGEAVALGLMFGGGMLVFRRISGSGDLSNTAFSMVVYTTYIAPDASLTKMVGSAFYEIVIFSALIFLTNRFLYVSAAGRMPAGPAQPTGARRPLRVGGKQLQLP